MTEHDTRDDYDDAPGRPRGTLEDTVRTAAGLIEAVGLAQFLLSVLGCMAGAGIIISELLTPPFRRTGDVHLAVRLLIISLVGLGWNTLVRRGGAAMGRFQSYRRAVLAAALAVLPVPVVFCGVVSLPVGIWALVVLFRPDVRARFETAARDTIKSPGPHPE